jgi:uncharacterized protein with HEPN domain
MLEAAEEAFSFAKGKTRQDLDINRMFTLSVVKCHEIMGEASAKISAETMAEYSEIPLNDIKGMKNRLIHVYFDIDLDLVWNTISEDFSPIIDKIRLILEKEKP